MDERTFWELVAQFLNAQQNPPDGPYAAVGADPYANDLPPLAPRYPGTTYMGNGTGTGAPYTSNAVGGPTHFEDGSYANNGGIESRYYPYLAVNAFPQYDRPRDPQMGQILRQFQHGLDQHQQHPNMRHEAQIEHSYHPVAGQPSMSAERRGPKRQPKPKNDPPVTTPSTPPIPVGKEAKQRVTTVPPKQQVRPGTSRPSHYGPAPKPAPVNTSAPRYVAPATQRGSFQGIRTSGTPSVAAIAKNMLRPKR